MSALEKLSTDAVVADPAFWSLGKGVGIAHPVREIVRTESATANVVKRKGM